MLDKNLAARWTGKNLLAQLTTCRFVVTIVNITTASLIIRFKDVTAKGEIIEVVIWQVPSAVPPSEHAFKYRAAYVVDGVRVVGFDNERGKGDHIHVDGREAPYAFTTIEQLMEDFYAAIEAARGQRQ